jgi:hypothetical protein
VHWSLFSEGGLELGSQSCSSIMVEKIFHSASNARLLHLQPGTLPSCGLARLMAMT